MPVLATIINLTWFYWGLEEFRITVTRSIFIKFITIACIFLFVKEKSDLWKYSLILSAGTFCGNIPLFLLLKKYVKFVKVDIKDILVHIKPNLILFIPALSVSVYRTMDKIMLGWLSTYSSVGYYENIDKIINICLGFITALGQVMLPKSANLVAKGKIDESNRLIVKSFKFSTLFCSALVFGLMSISDVFVPVFFGKEFMPSIDILMLLAPNLFLLAWGNVLKTQFLMPRGKDMAYIISTLLGAIINTIINIALIPKFSGIGAAIGTICAEFFSLMYILYVIKFDFDITKFIVSIKYIFAGIVMMFGVVVIKQFVAVSLTGLIILIVSGAIIYILECLILAYTLFDGKTAKIAWIISNFIFLTGIVVLLNAFLENKISKTDRWLVNSILLSCGCVRSQIHLGQHSLYAFFFFLLALWMSKKNKKIVSGLLLSISYFKYSITAPLALYFLYKKKYKELVVSFVPHIVLTLFSSWWLSINPIEIMLLPVKQATGLSTSGFADIGSILKSFGYHGSVMIFTVVIFIGLIIWVSFVKNKITDYGMLCILALWSLVFMYHRRYDYFVLILPFASIFMENTRKSKCWNICVCVLTIGVLTMGNFMDLESSVGKTVNSIMTSYIPYTSLCNVFNAILIALLYLVLFMSHRVFLENKRSIKKENEGEI